MANNLKVIIPWSDGKGFTQEKWDAALKQIEEFINNIKLTSDNINEGELTWTNFTPTIVDETKLTLETGSLSVVDNSLTGAEFAPITDPAKIEDFTIYPHALKQRVIVASNTTATGSLAYQDFLSVRVAGAGPTGVSLLEQEIEMTITTSGRAVILCWVTGVASSAEYGLQIEMTDVCGYTETWERETAESTSTVATYTWTGLGDSNFTSSGDDNVFYTRPKPLTIDNPPAGTHTYKYKITDPSSAFSGAELKNARLYCWEV